MPFQLTHVCAWLASTEQSAAYINIAAVSLVERLGKSNEDPSGDFELAQRGERGQRGLRRIEGEGGGGLGEGAPDQDRQAAA